MEKTNTDSKIYAPFSEFQVECLNKFQTLDVIHPFTCGNELCPGNSVSLVATVEGWICPTCDYRQNWAHKFMADSSWKSFNPFQTKINEEK